MAVDRQKVAVVSAAILAVALCGAAAGAVQRAPSRVISLVPAVTEMLFAIGAGDAVIAVSSYDTFPPEVKSRPKVGALVDPDFERMLSLRPDLVIVYGSQTDLMSRLDRARISYFEYAHAGLPDITQTIRAVGERVGRGPSANGLADRIERELEEIRRSVAGRPRPKAVLLFGREPGSLRNVYASAGVGFMHDMLELAGGTDIFGDIRRQNVQATTEMLLARAPDVIIEVHPAAGWTPARIKTEMNAWRGLPGLPAVKSGRIHILADDRLMVPGPRIVEAARLLRSFLHPG
jgi:iron complex transport system substrate-binding protein